MSIKVFKENTNEIGMKEMRPIAMKGILAI